MEAMKSGQLECGWSADHPQLVIALGDTANKSRSPAPFSPYDLRQAIVEIRERRKSNGEPLFDVNAVAVGENLATAAALCSIEHLKVLMEFGLDVHAKQGPSRSRNGTLLHNGTIGTPIAKLLDLGIDVDARSEDGSTPLHHHANFSNVDSVAELLRRGADPNAREIFVGMTPLIKATQVWEHLGAPAVIRALAQAGADLEAKTTNGMTAMHWAASCPSNVSILALAQAGANLDSEDNEGLRPLHHAAMKDRNSVFTLVALGASPWGVYSPKTNTHKLMHGPRLYCAFHAGSQDILAEHLRRFPEPDPSEVKKVQSQFGKKSPELLAVMNAHLALQNIQRVRSMSQQPRP